MKLVHGGDIEGYREKFGVEPVDFSANVSVLGLPESVKNAILKSIEFADRYPDPLCRKLRAKIAEVEGVDSKNVICGNGASDVIYRLVLGLKPKKALITAPTFAGYEEALRIVDCDIKRHTLFEENNFDLAEEILTDITDETDIAFICNPNNPTGRTVERNLLEKILKKCEQTNCILIVDECFIEFLEDTGKFTLKANMHSKNLFILKAFTKQFAMAGIRLGYGMTANENLISLAEKSGQAWSVSYMAQMAGIAAMGESEYLKKIKSENKKFKAELLSVLGRFGIKAIGHSANYVFFRTKIDGFWEKMAQKGVLIRSCANYNGLGEEYYRIAVRNMGDIEIFNNALSEISR